MADNKQPVKLTQGYIKKLIERTIQKDFKPMIEQEVRSSVHKILVEHGIIKPKKKTKEDYLLEKLAELKRLEKQVLHELHGGNPPGEEEYSMEMINEEYDPSDREEEIQQRITELESQEDITDTDRMMLQILKETRGATNSVDHRQAMSGRVQPIRAARVGDQPHPSEIAGSMYQTIPQNVAMIADPDYAMQHFENQARSGEPQQIDPIVLYNNQGFTEEDFAVGPVFAPPPDLEARK